MVLGRFFQKLERWEKVYVGLVAVSFLGISLFAAANQKFASHRYFATQFLDKRYDKTIELVKSRDKNLNEFYVFQEAMQDRSSPSSEKASPKKVQANFRKTSDERAASSKKTKASLCTFNKNLVISYLHKKFPALNWDPIEREYWVKMKAVPLYRIGDWLIGTGFTIFIYWFLPTAIIYLVLKKGVFRKA